MLPGDPAVAMLGEKAANPETYQALRRDMGLDDPIYVQYGRWLGKVVQGDFGKSVRTNEPVAEVLMRRVPVSLYYGVAGMLMGIMIGLPVAAISALKPGSKLDVGGHDRRAGRGGDSQLLGSSDAGLRLRRAAALAAAQRLHAA